MKITLGDCFPGRKTPLYLNDGTAPNPFAICNALTTTTLGVTVVTKPVVILCKGLENP